MRFKEFAGLNLVPLMSRVVLGAVFSVVGYTKVFTNTSIDGQDAAILQELGVDVTRTDVVDDPAVAFATIAWTQDAGEEDAPPPVTLSEAEEAAAEAAGELQDAGEEVQDDALERVRGLLGDPEDEDAGDEGADATTDPLAGDDESSDADAAAADAGPELPEPLVGEYEVRRLHTITAMLAKDAGGVDWPKPKWMGWAAGLTELVGGLFVLVGLLTRIAGLSLAGVMGMAFFLVGMGKYGVHETDPRTLALDPAAVTTIASQLGLLVLGFGLFLTGAGAFSIDRIIFGAGAEKAGKKKRNEPNYQKPKHDGPASLMGTPAPGAPQHPVTMAPPPQPQTPMVAPRPLAGPADANTVPLARPPMPPTQQTQQPSQPIQPPRPTHAPLSQPPAPAPQPPAPPAPPADPRPPLSGLRMPTDQDGRRPEQSSGGDGRPI